MPDPSIYEDDMDLSGLPDGSEKPEKPLELEPEEEPEEEPEAPPEGEEEAPEAEEEPAEAGEEKTEEKPKEKEEEPPGAAATLPDEVEIEGEKVSRDALIEGWKTHRTSKQKLDKVEGDFTALREDLVKAPGKALMAIYTAHHGGDRQKAYEYLRDIAFKVAEYDYQLNQMSDGERKAVFLQAERDELERKLKAREEAEKATGQRERERQIRDEIAGALKAAGLEENPYNIQRAALLMVDARSQGKVLPTAAAIEQVKKDLQKEREALLNSMNPDDLPDEFKRKLAQARVAKAKSSQEPEAKTTPQGPKPKAKKGRARNILVGMSDFGAFLDGEVEGQQI